MIACVGEAWGEEEAKQGRPFVGSSGKELRSMLEVAGITPHLTNVFNRRPGPSSNELKLLCVDKPMSKESPFSVPLARGLYLHSDHYFHIERLYKELADFDTVVALGNTATWALTGSPPAVGKMRGTFWRSPFVKAKILPTYHPAAVLREWKLRVIVILDLIKAKDFEGSSVIIRPSRHIYFEPDISDLEAWKADLLNSPLISIDIEVDSPSRKSHERYISCIAFSTKPSLAYVVPFIKNRWEAYWKTLGEEHLAWEFVRDICESKIPKVFQKHLFDTYVLRRLLPSIFVGGPIHDTLHLHHSLYPEIQKDLGFMGSIWTEEPAWKLERPRGKGAKEKRDD